MIKLHFFNEHIPSTRQYANRVGWARESCWRIEQSLSELSAYLEMHPDLCDIKAICADVTSAVRKDSEKISRIMRHYGFETIVGSASRRRLTRVAENILVSLMVFAQNSDTLRKDTLFRVRVPIFLSRRELRRRFSGGPHQSEERKHHG